MKVYLFITDGEEPQLKEAESKHCYAFEEIPEINWDNIPIKIHETIKLMRK